MRKIRWLSVVGGVVGVGAMLAAACGPASSPQQTEQVTSSGPTQQSAREAQPQAANPFEGGAAAAQQGGGTQATTGESVSVNGTPIDPEAKYGGILRTAGGVGGTTPSFLTWELCCSLGTTIGTTTTNALVQFRSYGTAEDFAQGAFYTIVPDLAKSWEQSPDGMEWTLHLVDGVKAHDGTPVGCEDAKWMLDMVRTPGGGEGLRDSPKGSHLWAIDQTACADATTLIITMKNAKPNLMEAIAFSQFQVFPKKLYENNLEVLRTTMAVGTGPFKAVQYLPGEKIVVERNADYWNKPFPYLDGIEMQMIDANATLSAIRTGRIHSSAYPLTSGPNADTLIKECSACVFWSRTFNPDLGSPTIHINHTRPPWDNPKMRDAFSYAIDRDKYNTLVHKGWAESPRTGLYPPATGWDMDPELVKTIPGWNFDDPEGNKEKARQILAEQGYQPGELKLNLRVWVPVKAGAPPLVEDLEAVGIDVTIEIMEGAQGYEIAAAGEFEIYAHSFGANNFTKEFGIMEHFLCDSTRNYGRFCNPEADRLIYLVERTLDPKKQKEYALQAAEIIMREHGKVKIGNAQTMPVFASSSIRGWMHGPSAMGQGAYKRHETTWLAE